MRLRLEFADFFLILPFGFLSNVDFIVKYVAQSKDIKGVKLLNFALITMDKQRLLGSGSFSKVVNMLECRQFYMKYNILFLCQVYEGSYRKKRCAVKLIFTVDLTEDVIRRVAAEARILSQIQVFQVLFIYV